MEFFIKQTATLPVLRVKVSKDGRSDFGSFMDSLDSCTIYFSMINVDTNIPKIIRAVANIEIIPPPNGIGDSEVYIYYKFKNKDTQVLGKYYVEFEIQTNMGIIKLPTTEKLTVFVTDSFITNYLPFVNNYEISYPCCDNSPELITIKLYGNYDPGSILIDYTLVINKILNYDLTLNFVNILPIYSGTPLYISTGVTISSGFFSGRTQLVLDENFNELTGESFFEYTEVIPFNKKYVFNSDEIISFPTPTPTPTPTATQTKTPTPTVTQTKTPTPTNLCDQFITNELGDLIITENGNYLISELNPCVTPTPTKTPTPTRTQTPTITPTNSVTPTNTPSVTPTITPTTSQEPLYPLTLYIQPMSGGQSIIFNGETYTGETTVNIILNTFYNIQAVPIPGYMFIGWNIFGGSFSSTGQSTTVAISLTSGANLAPSYDVDPNYDALEEQLTTSLVSYQNATDNNWVSITQQEYNNIFNNVDGTIKIGNNDNQINTRAVATGFDTTTFGTTDADTPLTIPTGYYVIGFIAESWNQNGQVQLGYTTTYHTGSPTYMGNSPNVIGGMTMFYVRKKPSGVEGAPSSTNLYPVLNFLSPAYPNAVPNTYGWQTGNGGATWSQTDSSSQTAKIQILLTNVVSWPT